MTAHNRAFCRAVRKISASLFPQGFDVSDHAPNTLRDLALHMARTGRMCVSTGNTDDHSFDNEGTYHAFRAWHDWCHVQGGHEFTIEGECATVRMQHAMVAAMFGEKNMRAWLPILHKQIIHDNFGDAAFCPITLGGA